MKNKNTKTRSLHELSEIFDECLDDHYGSFKIAGFHLSPSAILQHMSTTDYINVFFQWAHDEDEAEEYITIQEYKTIKDLVEMLPCYEEVLEKIRFEMSAETIWGYDYDCIEILQKLRPECYVSSLIDIANDLFDCDKITEKQLTAFKTIIQF